MGALSKRFLARQSWQLVPYFSINRALMARRSDAMNVRMALLLLFFLVACKWLISFCWCWAYQLHSWLSSNSDKLSGAGSGVRPYFTRLALRSQALHLRLAFFPLRWEDTLTLSPENEWPLLQCVFDLSKELRIPINCSKEYAGGFTVSLSRPVIRLRYLFCASLWQGRQYENSPLVYLSDSPHLLQGSFLILPSFS